MRKATKDSRVWKEGASTTCTRLCSNEKAMPTLRLSCRHADAQSIIIG